MTIRSLSCRTLLFAGVSALALAAASPEVRAADLTPQPALVAKAPVIAPAGVWTWWAEGGAMWTGGDAVWLPQAPTGLGIASESFKPRIGFEVAAGFDYRWPASLWHVSAQVRYGQAGTRTKARTLAGYYTGYYWSANATAKHKERHWLVDFAVGRDIGIGLGQTQLKAGLRIAELQAKTTGAGSVYVSYYGTYNFSFAQRSKFLGVGPRVGLEGAVPLGGAWSIDWLAGAAVLFGDRKFDAAANVTGPINLFGGGVTSSSNGSVLNVDAQAGVSYAFNPNAKLTLSYRFDGYWNALRTFDAAGNIANQDRFYHGPMVRLTVRN